MENTKTSSKLKLNYKRTALIGFAFFGILLLWQVYDSWCSPFLTEIFMNTFGITDTTEVQWLVGIVMACDNLAALLLLPIFGRLSDKTKTPIGKRMPYILLGTFISAIAFPFIPLFFHLNNIVGMIAMMAIVLIFMMMYRNPAVSLMPDITPKPLRARANGIINIMGYLGGACATFLWMFLSFSEYKDSTHNIWTIELPFIIASVLMVVSAMILFFTIKENKLQEELRGEMEEGEKLAEIANPLEEDKPLSPKNKRMLWGILIAEFLWFMADNAIGTFLSNYAIYGLSVKSGATGILTIIGGVASVVGFAIAGIIASKIGRKFVVSGGLALTLISYILMIFFCKEGTIDPATGYAPLPIILYVVFVMKGFGMALVHNCSFPMVVELATNKTIGKFTGHYYTASMLAQTITPILLGFILKQTQVWNSIPFYIAGCTLASLLVFFFVVENVRSNKVKDNTNVLESIGADED